MKRFITCLLFICIILGMLGMPVLAVNDEDLTGTTNSTEIDKNLDSDEDGIPDYLEIYFGTNEHLSDSDSDGVPDYIELYITWTDPLIPDGHIDTDGDGLTNAVESSFGTNADDKDTDNDRISDYDEIFLYQTDPLTKDGDDLLVNQATYTSNLTGVENTIAGMEEISSSRNGCYIYRTDSSGYVRFLASSELDRDVFLTGQLQMYPKNVNGYYRYETVDNWPTYSADIYQTPAFFMQLLAATMAQEVGYLDFTFIDVAPYLQQAKHCLMWLEIRGNIDYPHSCESYYLLAAQVS